MAKKRKRNVEIYSGPGGAEPLVRWLYSARVPKRDRARIRVRLDKLEDNKFGDHKQLRDADGVCELRFDFGPADYRVYYAEKENTIIVLTGGDKTTQPEDIEEAKALWKDWKENNNG